MKTTGRRSAFAFRLRGPGPSRVQWLLPTDISAGSLGVGGRHATPLGGLACLAAGTFSVSSPQPGA